MSMSREAKRYHEEYEAAPETIRWAVDSAYDEVVGICKAAGLPVSNCDAGETLVADIFKFIIKSKIEKDGWAEVKRPEPFGPEWVASKIDENERGFGRKS